ncbi:MAG: hypothetical protein ACYTDY_01710 [Planctomycetota bacterium]
MNDCATNRTTSGPGTVMTIFCAVRPPVMPKTYSPGGRFFSSTAPSSTSVIGGVLRPGVDFSSRDVRVYVCLPSASGTITLTVKSWGSETVIRFSPLSATMVSRCTVRWLNCLPDRLTVSSYSPGATGWNFWVPSASRPETPPNPPRPPPYIGPEPRPPAVFGRRLRRVNPS